MRLSSEQRKLAEVKTVNAILKLQEEKVELEERTRMQSTSNEWHEARKFLVSASMFGKIFNARSSKSYTGFLKSSMNTSLSTPAMSHGRIHEANAIAHFENTYGEKVEKCGIFLDKDVFYIGATPDGLVANKNALLEIKCPYFKENAPQTIREAIESKIGSCHKYLEINKISKKISLKRNHEYYAQVQGQLHVAEKDFSYFIVYLSVGGTFRDMIVDVVYRDKDYWEQRLPRLINYFHGTKLPNLVEATQGQNVLSHEEWRLSHNLKRLYSVNFQQTSAFINMTDNVNNIFTKKA